MVGRDSILNMFVGELTRDEVFLVCIQRQTEWSNRNEIIAGTYELLVKKQTN